jgi:hypothetical protein
VKTCLQKIAMSADELITWASRAKSTRVAHGGTLRQRAGSTFSSIRDRISKIQPPKGPAMLGFCDDGHMTLLAAQN